MPNFDSPKPDTPNFDTPNVKTNTENLKKQAKQYLRWHRERYYPVAARIRAALPRFRHLSDEQVLDANFKLADAQELVARQRGFEGWQALKSGAHAMPHEAGHTVSRPILSSTSAQLFVADIKASCDFYTHKLGFVVDFVYGDPPYYGQVTRDRARLALRVVGNLCSLAIFGSASICFPLRSPSILRTRSNNSF